MTSPESNGFPALGSALEILTLPFSFLAGLTTGILVPVAAVAGMVAAVRWLTGRFPFLTLMQESDGGERNLTLALVSEEQAKELYEQYKEEIGGELQRMQSEIKVIIEEAQAETKTENMEEEAVVLAEA
jgi:hypothetical protein